MLEKKINFYLDENCIEIVEKLQNINKKFNKIVNSVKKAEIMLEETRKEEIFEKIKLDVKFRK